MGWLRMDYKQAFFHWTLSVGYQLVVSKNVNISSYGTRVEAELLRRNWLMLERGRLGFFAINGTWWGLIIQFLVSSGSLPLLITWLHTHNSLDIFTELTCMDTYNVPKWHICYLFTFLHAMISYTSGHGVHICTPVAMTELTFFMWWVYPIEVRYLWPTDRLGHGSDTAWITWSIVWFP